MFTCFRPSRMILPMFMLAAGYLFTLAAYAQSAASQPATQSATQPSTPINSVKYQSEYISSSNEKTRSGFDTYSTYIGDEWLINETFHDGKLLHRIVMNIKSGETLSLSDSIKTAMRMTMTNRPANAKRNVIAALSQFDLSDATDLGEKQIGNHTVHGYLLAKKRPEEQETDSTVWLDTATRLPVEIVYVSIGGANKGFISTMKNFEWNIAVDPALLTLTPPAGYKIQSLSVDASEPTEQSVAALFRKLVGYSGGAFPTDLESGTIKQMMQDARDRNPNDPDLNDNSQKFYTQLSLEITKVYGFIRTAKYGSDWHYVGKDAKLGDKDRVILWYKPAGKEAYRTLDAELNFHDIAASDLPKVESIDLSDVKKTLQGPAIVTPDMTLPAGIKIRSVRYREVRVSETDGKRQESRYIRMAAEGWSYQEHEGDKYKSTMISDDKTGRTLHLHYFDNTASYLKSEPQAATGRNQAEMVASVYLNRAEDLGERKIGDRMAHGYRIDNPAIQTQETIWLDSKTRLPIEREEKSKSGNTTRVTHLTDFEWNIKIDEDLLALKLPAGFIDRSPEARSEQDVMNFYAFLKERGDVELPEKFDQGEFITALLRYEKSRHPEQNGNHDLRMGLMTRTMKLYGLAEQFIQNRAKGSDWHYAGHDVFLSDKNSPIMWYKPAGKETYRVIDAELNVRDVPAAEIPNVESVKLDSH